MDGRGINVDADRLHEERRGLRPQHKTLALHSSSDYTQHNSIWSITPPSALESASRWAPHTPLATLWKLGGSRFYFNLQTHDSDRCRAPPRPRPGPVAFTALSLISGKYSPQCADNGVCRAHFCGVLLRSFKNLCQLLWSSIVLGGIDLPVGIPRAYRNARWGHDIYLFRCTLCDLHNWPRTMVSNTMTFVAFCALLLSTSALGRVDRRLLQDAAPGPSPASTAVAPADWCNQCGNKTDYNPVCGTDGQVRRVSWWQGDYVQNVYHACRLGAGGRVAAVASADGPPGALMRSIGCV